MKSREIYEFIIGLHSNFTFFRLGTMQRGRADWRKIVLTSEETLELLRECLAEIISEISGVRVM